MTLDEQLEAATAQHRAGNLALARTLYGEVLAASPTHPVALFRCGLLELQDARPAAALTLIEQATRAAPHESRHHFGLGQSLDALARPAAAADAYARVIELQPTSADAHFALGNSLQSLGRYAEAVAAYERAVQLEPDLFAAFNNLGNCQQRRGRLPAAAAAYERALQLRPTATGTMANLGTVLQATGRLEEAVRLLRGAVEREPQVEAHAVNLGMALCRQRDFAAAEAVLRPALGRNPESVDALFNLGNALHGQGRWAQAAAAFEHALVGRPDHADAWINLGNVRKEQGEFAAAATAYDAAIAARPDSAVALNNAGCLLRTLGRLDEAEDMLRRGLVVEPQHAALHDNLGSVLKDAGELDAAIECFRSSLALNPDNATTHGNLLYALGFQSPHSAPIIAEGAAWYERFAAALYPGLTHANDRRPERRLRIGYVSPDFRDHCQSLFTTPLLARHDHSAFEIFCYASVERPDAHTQRIAAHADVWRDVRSLDDAALAAVITADRIDILVDLTMHMARGRPLLFARKPAPVQIAWLAYPGTTGLRTIDYRLSDPHLDPPDVEPGYSERTLRLPDAFWCYDPLAVEPAVNELPALARHYVTFGCLNNPCKLTDRTLELWGGVMRVLPDSRLRLMAPPGRHRDALSRRLAAEGVDGARVAFVPFQPRADYLRSYHEIDLGLDTLPYNGHTTSLDAAWMGVPTISRIGDTCVGRGGLSQSIQLGLPDLAADTDGQFVAAAVALASDLPRLAGLRRELRQRLERSPLMDAARFARSIEALYRGAWRAWCGGTSPAPAP